MEQKFDISKTASLLMEMIERIKNMEQKFDISKTAIDNLEKSFKDYLAVQDTIKELEKYYTSEQWKNDYDADCNGKLPQGLKRGVLSQDAVYNLLCDNDRILKILTSMANDGNAVK